MILRYEAPLSCRYVREKLPGSCKVIRTMPGPLDMTNSDETNHTLVPGACFSCFGLCCVKIEKFFLPSQTQSKILLLTWMWKISLRTSSVRSPVGFFGMSFAAIHLSCRPMAGLHYIRTGPKAR